jgi:anaerobic ribonucleoside-triphosphate reductase
MTHNDTTDITLFVKTSDEDSTRWNKQRIVDALMRETDVDIDTAVTISQEVEKQILSSGISLLTTPLIRELVNAKLIERGLEYDRRMHALLGFPIYDVRSLILHQNRENANVPHGPEGTNLLLAEGIKRNYAFHDVFSQDIVDAHIAGDIHLHGLGFIDRPYSSFQTLEYIKRFGLNLPHSLTVAKPAKHAEVLLAHMVRFGAILQGNFAGVIGWDCLNFSFAPYLSKMSDKEVRQFAQMLIYEFSQLTSARGGQSMFTDIHLYWDIPDCLRDIPAIGEAGEPTGKTYNDYIADARRFAWAIFEVFKKGDGSGKPFIFPRPLVHITDRFFQEPDYRDFLDHVCEVALQKGNPCFVFDRPGSVTTSGYDALCTGKKNTGETPKPPWRSRFSTLHNVTLNLPRLGYIAAGNDDTLFSLISERLELIAKAHSQKRDFIQKLLSHGDEGPLAILAMNQDGSPYLRMDQTLYLAGILGLNELVQIHRGKQLHESDDVLSFGVDVIARIREITGELGSKHGIKIVLEQTPAETTAYRFARLDLKYHSPMAGHYIKGNLARGELYYTNSTHLAAGAPVDAMARVIKEGRFHPLIEGNAMTHIWLSDNPPEKDIMAQFVEKAFHTTQNRQIIFSPDFTTCRRCNRTTSGLQEICPYCGSEEVEGISRITHYFSKISGWNKGKLAELRDRKRNTIS